MASAQVLLSIAIIIISFVIGFIFFYIISPLSKEEKRKHIEELVSLLINFIIFIWVGKIIMNLAIFISDPLAVLAYPSDSSAFYIACLLIILNIIYKTKRHGFQVGSLMISFIPIFLVANFVYEFLQMIWYGSMYSWSYMALLMILIILYLMLFEKKPRKTTYLLILGWSLGQLLLSILLPFTTVFSYILAPWFLGTILLVFLLLFLISNRKKVS